MSSIRFKIQQKVFKLLVNKANRLRSQENFCSNEHALEFVKKLEEAESFVEDIFIFEARPQYQLFSSLIEDYLEQLDNLQVTLVDSSNAKVLLVPSELLRDTIEGIENTTKIFEKQQKDFRATVQVHLLKLQNIYRIRYFDCLLQDTNQIQLGILKNLKNQQFILNEENILEFTLKNNKKITTSIKQDYHKLLEQIHQLKRMDGFVFDNEDRIEENSNNFGNDPDGSPIISGESLKFEDQTDISSTPNPELSEKDRRSQMREDDLKYIQETVGPAIRQGLAALAVKNPEDPMSYLANFLLHFRYNKRAFQNREEELAIFLKEQEWINSKDSTELAATALDPQNSISK